MAVRHRACEKILLHFSIKVRQWKPNSIQISIKKIIYNITILFNINSSVKIKQRSEFYHKMQCSTLCEV